MHASLVVAAGSDVQTLATALQGVGVDEAFVLGNAFGDHFLFDPLPDMVIGLLNPDLADPATPSLSNLDVMLRMGRAIEKGIPTLLIVPPPMSAPTATQGISYAMCRADAEELLKTHLWAFLAKVASNQRQSPPVPHNSLKTGAYRARLEQLKHTGRAAHFEELIEKVLTDAGAAVEVNPKTSVDTAIDFALIPSSGSPNVVLVECKWGNISERVIGDVEARLQQYVISRGAQLGVVIYQDVKGRRISSRHPTPLVVHLSADELLDGLESGDLPQVLSNAAAAAAREL